MNKKNLAIIGALLIFILGIIIYTSMSPKENKFKKEYESLNGEKTDKGKKYKSINIPSDNPIVYSNYDEIFKILDGTGIIYFGFPQCPWCRNAVPVLLEAAEEVGIDKIYYLNNLEDRDILSLKGGNVITEKEGTKNYKKLLEKLGSSASVYEGLEDESIKRLYFPTVIAVKNGKIIDTIVGTVDSQEDPYISLTKEQKKELKDKYIKLINETMVCDSKEKC